MPGSSAVVPTGNVIDPVLLNITLLVIVGTSKVEDIVTSVKSPVSGVVAPIDPFNAPPVEFNVVNPPVEGDKDPIGVASISPPNI